MSCNKKRYFALYLFSNIMTTSKDKEEPVFPHGNIIIIVIMFLIILALIIVAVQAYTVRVHPSTCPKVKGTYAVNPGRTGNILKQCGSGGEACTFLDIPDVSEAIHQCDIRADICTIFSYNSTSNTMNILDGTVALIPSSITDAYLRQT